VTGICFIDFPVTLSLALWHHLLQSGKVVAILKAISVSSYGLFGLCIFPTFNGAFLAGWLKSAH